MFNLDKQKLTEAISTLQRKVCAYDGFHREQPPRFCDCKYGISLNSKSYGEDTGCPELRDVKSPVRCYDR